MSDTTPQIRSTGKIGWWPIAGLLAVLTAGVVLLGIEVVRFQATVRSVRAAGGVIGFEAHPWVGIEHSDPWPFLDAVDVVNLYNSPLSEPELGTLLEHVVERFEGVRQLGLSQTSISDRTLVRLQQLQQLETLYLSGTEVSDDGVRVIAELSQLRELDLSDTKVSDAALPFLADLSELELLYLDHTSVGNEGIQSLKPLKKLSDLSLSNTNVSDEGLVKLGVHLPGLEVYDD